MHDSVSSFLEQLKYQANTLAKKKLQSQLVHYVGFWYLFWKVLLPHTIYNPPDNPSRQLK